MDVAELESLARTRRVHHTPLDDRSRPFVEHGLTPLAKLWHIGISACSRRSGMPTTPRPPHAHSTTRAAASRGR
jgi:hypothetical protein